MPTRVGQRAGGRGGSVDGGLVSSLKHLLGMPDYQRFVEHLRRCHPERPVPSEREFFEQYVTDRYGTGTTRCC